MSAMRDSGAEQYLLRIIPADAAKMSVLQFLIPFIFIPLKQTDRETKEKVLFQLPGLIPWGRDLPLTEVVPEMDFTQVVPEEATTRPAATEEDNLQCALKHSGEPGADMPASICTDRAGLSWVVAEEAV